MRTFVAAVFSVVLLACGGTYDTQCDGAGGIDCSLVGLPICTREYGDRAPHAFCTLECATDEDCGRDGKCIAWHFERGAHSVCVALDWPHY